MTFAEMLLGVPYTPPKGRRTKIVRNLNMAATPSEIEEREKRILKAMRKDRWVAPFDLADEMGQSRVTIATHLRLMLRKGKVEIKRAEGLKSHVRYRRIG